MNSISVNSGVPPFRVLREAWDYPVPAPYRPEHRVYMMRSVLGDIRFCPLRLPHRDQRLTELFERVQRHPSQLQKVKDRWKEMAAAGKVSPWNDCPMVGAYFPAFSVRAVNCLHDLLEPHGILLPLRHGRRRYYAFIARPLKNVLDIERSNIRTFQRMEPNIHRYVFKTENLIGIPIFTMRMNTDRTYVTDAFVQRVRESNLLGFNFEIVFPLKSPVDWKNLAFKNLKNHLSEGLPRGQSVSGQRVVVRFFIDNPNWTPTRRQEEQVSAWARKVFDVLWDPSSTAIPTGFVHRVEPDTGRCNVRFQGPDAEKLTAIIKPMLSECGWPGKVTVSKSKR